MKRIIKIAYTLAAGLLLLASCDTMETVYEQYKGDGPTQYVAKVRDVVVNPGFNKAKLSWGPLSDPRIKKVTISWANNAESRTFDWDPTTPFETVVDGIEEGSVIFSIYTFDSKGNKSVRVDVPTPVYGESFAKNIEESTITNGTYNETTNEIKLAVRHTVNVYYKGLQLIYKNLEGEEATYFVEKGVNTVSIFDAADLNIRFSSVFAPQEDCLEYYESEAKLYEALITPVFELESDNLVLAAAGGCSKTLGLTANRAPIHVTTEADWLDVSENSGIITVKTNAANDSGAARIGIVSVSAKDGKVDITVKQTKNRIGEVYGTEGVIWWQNNEDPFEYKIISAARGNCKWSTATVDTKTSSESGKSTVNGVTMDNNDILMSLGDENVYPAVWWCHNLGDGWYMPSGAELKSFIEAYNGNVLPYASLNNKKVSGIAADLRPIAEAMNKKFNDAMLSLGAPMINEQPASGAGDWLWSNQQNTTANAYAARLGQFGYGGRSKKFDGDEASGPFYTRAMKVVRIED